MWIARNTENAKITNQIATKSAIEAARAFECGQGFAVVAAGVGQINTAMNQLSELTQQTKPADLPFERGTRAAGDRPDVHVHDVGRMGTLGGVEELAVDRNRARRARRD
jgi:methyl-accepting chemotaxis protein